MRSRLTPVLVVAAAAWLRAAPSAHGAAYAPISEQVCSSNADTSANVLSKLPRVSLFQGKVVSSDLGSYNLLDCSKTATSSSLSCAVVNPLSGSGGASALVNNLKTPPAGKATIINYAEPIAWYGILAFVMAILSVLFTVFFIIGRYCCCCCPRAQGRWCCICIQCGAHEPTRRTCCCGVVDKKEEAEKPLIATSKGKTKSSNTPSSPQTQGNAFRRASGVGSPGVDIDGAVGVNDGPVGASKGFSAAMLMASPASTSSFVTVGSPSSVAVGGAASPSSPADGATSPSAKGLNTDGVDDSFEYPKLERRLTLVLMLVFWAFIFSFTVIGAILGVEGIPKGLATAAPRLTNAYMPLVNAVYKNVQSAAIGMTSNVVVPQTLALNTTFQGGFSIPVVDSALTCVVARIDDVPGTDDIIAPVRGINASIANVKTGVVGLITAIQGLGQSKTYLSGNVTALQGTVASLSTALGYVSSNLTAVDAAIVPIEAAQTSLLSSPKLLIDTVSAAVAALEPGASGTLRVPTATEINAVTGPEDGSQGCNNAGSDGTACPSLNDVISGQLDAFGVTTNLARVQGQQVTFNTTLGNMRQQIVGGIGRYNYSAIADAATEMQSIATALKNVQIPALLAAITATEAAIAALPSSNATKQQVRAVQTAANGFSFRPIYTNLDLIASTVASVPSLNIVVSLLDRVKAVSGIIPCAVTITNEIRRVNTTLVALPSSLLDAFNVIDSANATIASALAQVSTVQDQLRSADAQIRGFNTASQRTQVVTAELNLNQTLLRFNFGSVDSSLGALDTSIPVNFTSMKGTLNTLSAQLGDTGLNASTIDQIRTVEALKTAIVADVASLNSDFTRVIGNAGSYGCSNNVAVHCSSSTQTATCGAGNYCMPDIAAATRLKWNLTALRIITNQGMSAPTIVSSLNSMKTAASGVQASSYRSSIASAISSINSVDTARMSTELGNVGPSINLFDSSAVDSQLNGIKSQIEAVDVGSSFTAQLDQLNSTLKMVKVDARDTAVDIRSLLRSVKELLNVNLGTYARTDLDASRLNGIANNEGMGSLVYAILAVADDAANTLLGTPMTSKLLSGVLPAPPQLASKKVFGYTEDEINKITASGKWYKINRQKGLINWAVSSLPFLSSVKTVPSNDTRAYGVFKTLKPGNPSDTVMYGTGSNKRYCLMDECIAKSVTLFADSPIGDAPDELEEFGVSNPVPQDVQSRTEQVNVTIIRVVNGILWVFPGAVLFLGLLGLLNRWLCNCRCCYKSCCKCCCNAKNRPKWEKCPYGCMTGCILFQIPCCFVLAGLFFPAMMVIGDVCASGPNVAYSAVLQLSQDTASVGNLCSSLPSSKLIATSQQALCNVAPTVSLPSGEVTAIVNASINFAAYTKALLGEGTCSSASALTGGSTSPWDPVVAQVISKIRTLPVKEAQYLLTDPKSPLAGTVTLRPAMLNWALGATNATADLIATTLQSFVNDVASCEALNTALQSTTDVVCCNLVTPLYWLGSVFFLIAWGYVCCGVPVGLLARKRLVSRPWGSQMRAQPPTGCCGSGPKSASGSGSNKRRASGVGRSPLTSEPPAARAAAAYSANDNHGGWGQVANPDAVGVELTNPPASMLGGPHGSFFVGTSPLHPNNNAANPLMQNRAPGSLSTAGTANSTSSFAPTGTGGRGTLAAGGITYSVGGFMPALASSPTQLSPSAPPANVAIHGDGYGTEAGDPRTDMGGNMGNSSRKVGFSQYAPKKSEILQTPAAAAASSNRNLNHTGPRPSIHAAAAAAAAAAAVVEAAGLNPVGPGANDTVRDAARLSPAASRSSSARSSNSSAPGSPGRAGLPGYEDNPSPLVAAGVMSSAPKLASSSSSGVAVTVATGTASGDIDIDAGSFASPGFAARR